MKKTFILFFILLFSFKIFSADIITDFSLTNWHINDSNLIDSSAYSWELDEIYENRLNENFTIESGYNKKVVTGHSAFSDITYFSEYYGLTFGIFSSFLTGTGQYLTPGFHFTVNGQLPGLLFLKVDSRSTIGGSAGAGNAFTISSYDFSLGFYAGSAIVSFHISQEGISSGNIEVTNSNTSNSYFLHIDLYRKNRPFRIEVNMGYNTISRSVNQLSYDGSNFSLTTTDYKAGTVFLQAKGNVEVMPWLRINTGIRFNLLKFPLSNMAQIPADKVFFTAHLGVTFTLE